MDGHGINHLSNGWAWMGTGWAINHLSNHLSDDGHGINHLSNGWARDKSFIKWMGTG